MLYVPCSFPLPPFPPPLARLRPPLLPRFISTTHPLSTVLVANWMDPGGLQWGVLPGEREGEQ